MNEVGDNEQTDADILQCREDVLRASDVVPPYKGDTPKTPAEAAKREDDKSLQAKEIEPRPAEAAKRGNDKPLQVKETGPGRAEIPRFDLAKEIMAEQRKVTAIKRKGPGKKTEPAVEPIRYVTEPQGFTLSEQEQIITEIVARDIERLCGVK